MVLLRQTGNFLFVGTGRSTECDDWATNAEGGMRRRMVAQVQSIIKVMKTLRNPRYRILAIYRELGRVERTRASRTDCVA